MTEIRPEFDAERMAWRFPVDALAKVGLAHMHRRRFLSSSEARKWLARMASR